MVEQSDSLTLGKHITQGRRTVERYTERLLNAAQRLRTGPEASELYCAVAELYDGISSKDQGQTRGYYEKAVEAFSLSRPANFGLRRIARSQGEYEVALAAIERDISNAGSERKVALKLEKVRTLVYVANRAQEAKAVLEELEQGLEEESFSAERFFLWEDILWALEDWKGYEGLVRQALKAQSSGGEISEMLAYRLMHLYRYVLGDEEKAMMLCQHLIQGGVLNTELVSYQLRKLEREGEVDAILSLLHRALKSSESQGHEILYRMMMSDILQYQRGDFEGAIEIIKEGIERHPKSLILLVPLLSMLSGRDEPEEKLEALSLSLDCVSSAESRAETLYEIGCILRDELGQEEASFDIFVESNACCPVYAPSLVVLGRAYSLAKDWSSLASLYEQEIGYAKEHASSGYGDISFKRLHFRLAQIYGDKLGQYEDAFRHYCSVLSYRADDLAALKGASRMAAQCGQWGELLKVHAEAEAVIQDDREHAYLLEKIAQISEDFLDDLDTACTALEGLRALGKVSGRQYAALARLYLRLGRYESLVELSDEEILGELGAESKASLLFRNAEICEEFLSDSPRARRYYESCLEVKEDFWPAYDALGRLLERHKEWEKLVELGLKEAEVIGANAESCRILHGVAEILDKHLARREEAMELYERCVRIYPQDRVARGILVKFYEGTQSWEDLVRVLRIEAENGGHYDQSWVSYFRMGQIYEHRLKDAFACTEAYQEAFLACPENPVLMRAWLTQLSKHEQESDPRPILNLGSSKTPCPHTRAELLIAIAERSLSESQQISEAAARLEIAEQLDGGYEIYSTILSMFYALKGRWSDRLRLCSGDGRHRSEQLHALEGFMHMGIPSGVLSRCQTILCEVQDVDKARRLWVGLSPSDRPGAEKISKSLLSGSGHDAQDLRRWSSLCRLLSGLVNDPTSHLLPDDRDERVSLRPDLELLASYFECFEKWSKLLEVLEVQIDNTRNEQERIQVILQKAWVLTKLKRPKEAVESVQEACKACSFSNPLRLSLYDYLRDARQWEFLIEQIRQHLMHTDNPEIKTELWQRLAFIYEEGLKNAEEALRCLDQGYRILPADGKVLTHIAEIAQKIGETSIARRALDDYLQFHGPSLEDQLMLAPKVLHLHFEVEGGKPEEMLRYFESLSQSTAQSPAALRVLGKAHAIAGNPASAAEIFLRLVKVPFVSEDVDLWIGLAKLYCGPLQEKKKGEELLWNVFGTFPEDNRIYEALDEFYSGQQERIIFVENLKRSVENSEKLQKDGALARKILGKGASILGNELGMWKQAQELYSLALDVCGEAETELIKNRAYARCKVPGEASLAYREFCEILSENPLDLDILETSLELCRQHGAFDRERILLQLGKAFHKDVNLGGDEEMLRPKVGFSRGVSDEYLKKHLCDPDLNRVHALIHEALPLFDSVYKDDLPKRNLMAGQRNRDAGLADIFNNAGLGLNLGHIRVDVGHDPTAVPMVFEDPLGVWLAMELWEAAGQGERRHIAGCSVGLLWTGISRIMYYDSLELWKLLDGAHYLVTGDGISGKSALTLEASEKVKNPWLRRERKEISALIDEIGEYAQMQYSYSWKKWLLSTGDRAGLLMSGDLGASLNAIMLLEGSERTKIGGEELQSRYSQNERLKRVVKFALSDDYLDLRFYSGLGGRKSEFY